MDANEEFIKRIYPAAIKVAQETGMSWELLLAQAAHETGWGKKVLEGTNNVYNIKASSEWKGKTKTFRVWERDAVSNEKYWTDSAFRVYDSVEESIRDRVKFLRDNPRYAKSGLFDEGTLGDLRKEAEALERARFATDENYADKIVEVFHGRTMRRSIAAAQAGEVESVNPSRSSPTILKEGARGQQVAQLQMQLARLGYMSAGGEHVDGQFGEQTRLALQAFQRNHDLRADGIAGPLTFASVANAIRIETRTIGSPDAPYLLEAEHRRFVEPYQSVPSRPVPSLGAAFDRMPREGQALQVDALHASRFDAPDSASTIRLQESLNTLGMTDRREEPLSVHGVYDLSTKEAVARFQRQEGLPITGLADEAMRRTIDSHAFMVELRRGHETNRYQADWTHDGAATREGHAHSMARSASVEPIKPVDAVSIEGPTIQWRDKEGPTIQWRQSAVDPLESDRVLGPERSADVPRSGYDTPLTESRTPEPKPGLSDPRNPENPQHGLYTELGRRIPDASEDRLLQFTAACHTSRITADNLSICHLDEQNLTIGFLGNGRLSLPVTVDLKKAPPEPEQAIEQIAQYDHQQAQVRSEYLAQQQQMSRSGPSL
ncbi:peptidoglycan-binding protein [Luteibacter sp. 329MFSha]|uniref:peptidoglycan-binding protein n=1 Tax=Luteibacter sp. 329MFSha TaxID=1798239 RepID=UPI0008ACE89D|nr:peptidoglycan-binding protein [Luteibacter sp. 329MFSha]SEW06395.1 Putative peptidoglycan binding domain-containing protein [Luteibacter sp. 329MFSha]